MEDEQNQGNSIFGIIFILILIGAGYFLWNKFTNKPEIYTDKEFDLSSYTTAKRNDWELTLYSSSSPNYQNELDVIKGLASKEACLSEGNKRVQARGSFECSYKCKTQYTDFQGTKDKYVICEKVCDDNGDCRD